MTDVEIIFPFIDGDFTPSFILFLVLKILASSHKLLFMNDCRVFAPPSTIMDCIFLECNIAKISLRTLSKFILIK